MTTQRRSYGVQLERSLSLKLERHPDAPRRQPWRSWVEERAEEGPVAVDLFCGAGGLSLGLERAGYTVVLSTDNDRSAVQTHLANFPGSCLELDLADPDRVDDLLTLLEGVDIDLVAGGPPCQPFSRAGRSKIRDLVDRGVRDPVDPRRELWRVFLRVVEEVRPRTVLMENVPEMALGDDARVVRFIADRLEALGYETDMRIVEAWRHGVPQHRHRLLLVAYREGTFAWPEESAEIDLRDAIGDLPKLGRGTGRRELAYAGPESAFQKRARGGVPSGHAGVIFDHFTRPVRPDDRAAFELMAGGLTYAELPSVLKRYRDDIFDDKYNRLRWDDRSRSITAHIAKDGYWYIHPEEQRTLTVREAARIQTFPDDFRFAGTRSDAFRLIGNAVPPLLGEAISGALRAGHNSAGAPDDILASTRRAEARRMLLKWSSDGPVPAWRHAGHPWRVLVGTLIGRLREGDADAFLERFPAPADLTPGRQATLTRNATTEKQRRTVRTLGTVARRVVRLGWDDGTWKKAARVSPSDALWVEAVGLGVGHVPATAGAVRVAGRVLGSPGAGGVAGRLLLAQLLGHSENTPAVIGAVGGLAQDVCRPVPKCELCPIAEICMSAGRVDLREPR